MHRGAQPRSIAWQIAVRLDGARGHGARSSAAASARCPPASRCGRRRARPRSRRAVRGARPRRRPATSGRGRASIRVSRTAGRATTPDDTGANASSDSDLAVDDARPRRRPGAEVAASTSASVSSRCGAGGRAAQRVGRRPGRRRPARAAGPAPGAARASRCRPARRSRPARAARPARAGRRRAAPDRTSSSSAPRAGQHAPTAQAPRSDDSADTSAERRRSTRLPSSASTAARASATAALTPGRSSSGASGSSQCDVRRNAERSLPRDCPTHGLATSRRAHDRATGDECPAGSDASRCPAARARPRPRPPTPQPLDPTAPIELTVVLRRRADGELGADPADVDAVRSRPRGGRARDRRRRRAVAPHPGARRRQLRCRRAFGTELRAGHQPGSGRLAPSPTASARVSSASPPRSATACSRCSASTTARRPAASSGSPRPQASAASYTPLQLGAGLRLPGRTPTAPGQSDRDHRARRRVRAERPRHLLRRPRASPAPTVTAVGVDGAANQPGQDPQGADGEVLLDIEVAARSRPARRSASTSRPTPTPASSTRSARPSTPTPTPAGDQHQLGAERGPVDGAGPHRDGQRVRRRGRSSASSSRPRPATTAAATAPATATTTATSPPRARTCSAAAARRCTAQRHETVWNNGAGNGATGGGVSDAFARPPRQANVGVPGAPAEACPTSPATPTRRPATRCSSTARRPSSAAPARSRRCGPALVARLAQATGGLLHGFADTLYAGRDRRRQPVRVPRRHQRRQRQLLAPARAGTPAPGSAARTAPRCSRGCRAA